MKPQPQFKLFAHWPDGGLFTAHAGDDLTALRAKMTADLKRVANLPKGKQPTATEYRRI